MTKTSTVHKSVLDNGVRILLEPNDIVKSAAIGLWCQTGSRDEFDTEAGITHLIEHMLFKGTSTRTAKEIADEIEGRGGMLNAFTDKEATCYYCRVLAEDVLTGIEVLCDMMTNSLLEADELEREKGVVLEEIKRSEDEPSDHVHELHLQGRWGNHPLGKPVIGSPCSVSSFGRQNLSDYMSRRYRGSNVVLAIAGNLDASAVLAEARERLGGIAVGSERIPIERPRGKASKHEVSKDVEQVHFCIGTDGTAVLDDDLYVQVVLDGALGGGMGSRLFQEIREKRGLAYSVGSYCLNYLAGGAYTVFGGTGANTWEQVQSLVATEFENIRKSGLAEDELARVKRNLRGNLVLSLEGMSARMMRMTRNELAYGRDIPVEETLQRLDAVTNDQVIEHARKILDPELVSTTAIGPF